MPGISKLSSGSDEMGTYINATAVDSAMPSTPPMTA